MNQRRWWGLRKHKMVAKIPQGAKKEWNCNKIRDGATVERALGSLGTNSVNNTDVAA